MYNRSVSPPASAGKALHKRAIGPKVQKGSSLVELLVGITLGLMVVTAAIGTLVFSRTASVAVNDQLELQQQANMAMRIMATTLRQANTRELVADGLGNVLFSPVPVFNPSPLSLQGLARDVQGNDNIGIAFSDAGGAPAVATRDCLGNTNAATLPGPSVPVGGSVSNRFFVDTNRLMCAGTAVGTGPQPLISDVQRFRVLYGVQTGIGAATITNYFTQANVPDWNTANVVAVELCLELATRPRGSANPPGNYINCDGNAVANDQRTRAIVRQTVRLRSVPVV
jgi:type IV pilus assembly protein PilW